MTCSLTVAKSTAWATTATVLAMPMATDVSR